MIVKVRDSLRCSNNNTSMCQFRALSTQKKHARKKRSSNNLLYEAQRHGDTETRNRQDFRHIGRVKIIVLATPRRIMVKDKISEDPRTIR